MTLRKSLGLNAYLSKHSLRRYVNSLGLPLSFCDTSVGVSANSTPSILVSSSSFLLRKPKYNVLKLASIPSLRSLNLVQVNALNHASLLSNSLARSIEDGCNPTIMFQSVMGTLKQVKRSNRVLGVKLELRALVLAPFARHRVWNYGYGRTNKAVARIKDVGQSSLVTYMGLISVSTAICSA